MAEGLGILSSINLGQVLYGIQIVMGLLVLAVLVYFIGNRSRYNIKVDVKESRGDKDFITKIDYAKIAKNKEGVTKLRLLKGKVDLDIPDAKYFRTHTGSIFFKKSIEINQYSPTGYALPTIELTNEGKSISVPNMEKNMGAIMHLARKTREMLDNKNFWERWGVLIIHVALFAMLFGMLIFTWNGMAKVGANMENTANQFEHAAEVLSKCTVAPQIVA